MKEYISLDVVPPEENSPQVGELSYNVEAVKCADRYIELLKKVMGPPPSNVFIKKKWNGHDFGQYLDIIVTFDTDDVEGTKYALACESYGPLTWDDDKPFDWRNM